MRFTKSQIQGQEFGPGLALTNRLLYLSNQTSTSLQEHKQKQICSSQALIQVSMASQDLTQSDFAVIDDVVDESPLSEIANQLLLSTIFFDVTNGQVFGAFHDDGLVFPDLLYLSRVSMSHEVFCNCL